MGHHVGGLTLDDARHQPRRLVRVVEGEQPSPLEGRIRAQRIEALHLAEEEERILEPPLGEQQLRDAEVHVGTGGIELEGATQLEQRLLVLALLEVGVGAREMLRATLDVRRARHRQREHE